MVAKLKEISIIGSGIGGYADKKWLYPLHHFFLPRKDKG